MIKLHFVLLFFLFFHWCLVTGKNHLAVDNEVTDHHTRTDLNRHYNIKLIKEVVGFEVRLMCGLLHKKHAEFMTTSELRWEFKPCSFGLNRTSCQQILNDENVNEWRAIDCDGKPCRVTLIIKNTTENDSGLYRCSISPYKTDAHTTSLIKIVTLYQLEVTSRNTSPPELLDNLPANTTVLVDSQVVLQCRVHSEVQPEIRWFRKQSDNRKQITKITSSSAGASTSSDSLSQLPTFEANNLTPGLIKYLENTYELVVSAGERVLTEDTYLSKLIINNVSESDIGVYVCVGINYGGVEMREAYLNLIYNFNNENIGSLRVPNSNINELLFLFLIPLGFAVIPIFVWICYVLKEKRKRKEQSMVNDQALVQPFNNLVVNNYKNINKHIYRNSNRTDNSNSIYNDNMIVGTELRDQYHQQFHPQQQYGKHKRPYAIINVNIV